MGVVNLRDEDGARGMSEKDLRVAVMNSKCGIKARFKGGASSVTHVATRAMSLDCGHCAKHHHHQVSTAGHQAPQSQEGPKCPQKVIQARAVLEQVHMCIYQGFSEAGLGQCPHCMRRRRRTPQSDLLLKAPPVLLGSNEICFL